MEASWVVRDSAWVAIWVRVVGEGGGWMVWGGLVRWEGVLLVESLGVVGSVVFVVSSGGGWGNRGGDARRTPGNREPSQLGTEGG